MKEAYRECLTKQIKYAFTEKEAIFKVYAHLYVRKYY